MTLRAPLPVLLLLACAAPAAAFPERPIRWVVPAAAGGGADASARVIAAELGNQLGQQVVVDNRPGGGGVIGIELVARAGADGHTMGSGNSTNIVMNRSVQVKLPYDPDTDLRAVIQTHFQPNLLAVHPALPAKTVRELIDYAQRNPGKLLYASSGNGSSLHFAAELFKLMSGASMDHVPYASIPVGVNDLMAGRVHVIFDNMSSIAPHVKSGRVRGLGVTSAKRSPVFPELPTIAESGLPGYEIVAWSGLVVPAGTPGRIVDKLNAAAARALAAAAVREKLQALGLEIVGGTPEQFARLIRSETAKWAEVAKRTGIRPE